MCLLPIDSEFWWANSGGKLILQMDNQSLNGPFFFCYIFYIYMWNWITTLSSKLFFRKQLGSEKHKFGFNMYKNVNCIKAKLHGGEYWQKREKSEK